MYVLWRYRLAVTSYAVLLFIVCYAQEDNEMQNANLMYSRGNHWAVGHLMGRKSLDYDRDGGREHYVYVARGDEEQDGNSKPSGLLRTLITVLAGPESETGRARESVRKRMPKQDTLAQSRLREQQLTRAGELKQGVKLLLLALRRKANES